MDFGIALAGPKMADSLLLIGSTVSLFQFCVMRNRVVEGHTVTCKGARHVSLQRS